MTWTDEVRAPDQRPVVAVVGGGISGLAAAWQLSSADPSPDVVVLEGAPQVGGKLSVQEVAGIPVDVGAESVLARRPEALDLAREVGLADGVVPARQVGAWVWSRGGRWALPAGTLMGVPSGPDGLTGLLTAEEVAPVRAEPDLAWDPELDPDADIDVASLVASRLGRAVVDRLVQPLLGGVYAGQAEALSLRATVPALWHAAVDGRSVVATAREATAREAADQAAGPARSATPAPLFMGIRGGVGRLPPAVAGALRSRGVEIRTSATVRSLQRCGHQWRLVIGPVGAPMMLHADAVVLATPARPTSRLLAGVLPDASAALATVEYASVALVTWLFPRRAVQGLAGSGVLVPPVDGHLVKAATFSSSKWQWLDDLAPEHVVVRASIGGYRQEQALQLDDDRLAVAALDDLRGLPGARLPAPAASTVTRWGAGLPQYAVGHVHAVAAVARSVATAAGLELAGAAYEGVGVPACIASGRLAAQRVLIHLSGDARLPGTMPS